jgi:hypothetical protein
MSVGRKGAASSVVLSWNRGLWAASQRDAVPDLWARIDRQIVDARMEAKAVESAPFWRFEALAVASQKFDGIGSGVYAANRQFAEKVVLMAGRPVLSILLAAVVVSCPFHCNVWLRLGDHTEAAGCCCHGSCSGEDRATTVPAPAIPTPVDCDCSNCFCSGALPIVEFDLGENNLLCEYWLSRAEFDQHWRWIGGLSAERTPPIVLPSHLPGIDLRAALSSWTI